MTIKDYKHSRSDMDKLIAIRTGTPKQSTSNILNRMLSAKPKRGSLNAHRRLSKGVTLPKLKFMDNDDGNGLP